MIRADIKYCGGMIAKLLRFTAVFAAVVFMPYSVGQTLRLVADEWPTYVEYDPDRSRLTDLASAILNATKTRHNIDVSTLAMSVSGLKAGRYDGYIDQLSLLETRPGFIYSQPFFTHHLHIVSKQESAQEITSQSQLRRERVGIVRRFADSDRIRNLHDVRWARVPTDFDNFRQLADDRVDFILADRLQVEEFNRLLAADGEELLYISQRPMISVNVSLGIKADIENAKQLIAQFDDAKQQLLSSGQINRIMDIAVLLSTDAAGNQQLIVNNSVEAMPDAGKLLQHAYKLGAFRSTEPTSYRVDGRTYETWNDAREQVRVRPVKRGSLLDDALYKPLVDSW
ncbi:substrate-binding periplasmic protein [Aestuariibacter salexigens]|uniref:substrate-binding periplasmic protein n=1 Tax=Aestuariibacter salexigens TaxID=226010 RepID=UPI0003FB22EB|nr:ABC transporter substrate-binding protein [Aestuariibacter salexigens]